MKIREWLRRKLARFNLCPILGHEWYTAPWQTARGWEWDSRTWKCEACGAHVRTLKIWDEPPKYWRSRTGWTRASEERA